MKNKSKSPAQLFTGETVGSFSKLANIPVTDAEKKALADGFNTTLEVVNKLFKVKVEQIEPLHQVTGLKNVMREDEVDEARMFTQEQALANAVDTYQGYFLIGQIINPEEN